MALLPAHWDPGTPACKLGPHRPPTSTLSWGLFSAYRGTVTCLTAHWNPGNLTCTLGPHGTYLHIEAPSLLPTHWDTVALLPVHLDPRTPLWTRRPCGTLTCTLGAHDTLTWIFRPWDPYLYTGNPGPPNCILRPLDSYPHIEAAWHSCQDIAAQDSHLLTGTPWHFNQRIELLTAHRDPMAPLLEHWDHGTPTCTLGPHDTSTCTLRPWDSYLDIGATWHSYHDIEAPGLLPAHWESRGTLTCTLRPASLICIIGL